MTSAPRLNLGTTKMWSLALSAEAETAKLAANGTSADALVLALALASGAAAAVELALALPEVALPGADMGESAHVSAVMAALAALVAPQPAWAVAEV